MFVDDANKLVGEVGGSGGVKEALYPRRETAVCICPSSGGGRFKYTNCFCTGKLGGIGALREVLQRNSLYFPQDPPDMLKAEPLYKLPV